MFCTLLLICNIFFVPVLSQLPLPNPPFLPPNPSPGSQPTSGSSIPNPQWSTLIGNLLYFYEAQRSGNLPSSNRVSWRNSSCTDDGKDVGLDLSGGYYDAGDYIKATFPLAFTLMSICWGATDFGRGYDLANQTAYLDDMLRWGLDWLIKAHPSNNTLYVAVADPNLDNDYWGGDQNIPKPRPSYQINSTHPGTDAAAGTAAAFAACSNLYNGRVFGGVYSSPASLQNSSYAQTLLQHAQQLYSFATTASPTNYQKSAPAAGDAYASSTFGDDLSIAALFLAFGTNSTSLYKEAEDHFNKYKLGGQNIAFNWNSKTSGLYILFSQVAQSSAGLGGSLTQWQNEAERYLDKLVSGDSGDSYFTPGGLLWYPFDSPAASLNPALNAAMLMHRYAPMASSDDKKNTYTSFARRQLDYALGENPMSVPYVVGVNPNSPSNPHSAAASGGNDGDNIDTSPPTMAHTLYGAVIGGPDKTDRYFDIRSDWPETEVALDYNAPMLTLAAMRTMSDGNDPYYTALQAGEYDKVKPQGRPCDEAIQDGCSDHSLSTGAIVALAVVLSLVGLAIIGLLIWYFLVIRRRKKTG
ncbi:glycoside hydrolase family 9 protein [Marasmius fiardii PR-910]|nr:glycoside hydrolase family 9 protein [Marasmius fiardii PR-910]